MSGTRQEQIAYIRENGPDQWGSERQEFEYMLTESLIDTWDEWIPNAALEMLYSRVFGEVKAESKRWHEGDDD